MLNYWILQTIAMAITALLLPGLKIRSIFGAVFIVGALSLVTTTIWSAELFFSLPVSLSMNTLLLLLANGVIFFILVKLLPGIDIETILSAILAPILFTVLSVVLMYLGEGLDWWQIADRTFGAVEDVRDYFEEQPDLESEKKDKSPKEKTEPEDNPALRILQEETDSN